MIIIVDKSRYFSVQLEMLVSPRKHFFKPNILNLNPLHWGGGAFFYQTELRDTVIKENPASGRVGPIYRLADIFGLYRYRLLWISVISVLAKYRLKYMDIGIYRSKYQLSAKMKKSVADMLVQIYRYRHKYRLGEYIGID